MKGAFTFLLLLCGLWSSSSIAQSGERQTTGNVPIEFYGKVVDQTGAPYSLTMKKLAGVLLACLLPISAMAQQDEFYKTGNLPIDFYAKVVDQNGQPIAEAKVNLEIYAGHMTSATEGEMRQDKVTLKTDQNGEVALTDAKGVNLTVLSIDKKGYELSQKVNRTFGGNATPVVFTPDQPAIFTMWKKNGAQPLVHSAWRGLVACDGTQTSFAIQGTEENLQIACTRTPLTSPPPGNGPFDYKFEIALAGGGIKATSDEFTYLAPESGYSPSVTIGKKAGEAGWVGRVKQEFYIETADGHYGRLTVDWYAAQDSPTHLEWECFINPTGSRNLEYDKLAEIRKHSSHPQFIHSPDE